MSIFPDELPFIVLSKDGTDYRLPVQLVAGRDGMQRPIPIARSPKLSYPQPIAIAGPEGGPFRRNYDIDEVVITTWDGGMGEDTHALGEVRTYQWGQCDTRWPNILVNRPATTQLGSDQAGVTHAAGQILETTYAGASLIWWSNGFTGAGNDTKARYWTGATWTTIADTGAGVSLYEVSQVIPAGGGLVLASRNDLARSADGVTWESATAGANYGWVGAAWFDERVWRIKSAGYGSLGSTRVLSRLSSSVDFLTVTTATTATWTDQADLITSNLEEIIKLFVWMYPLDRGKPTLWMLTNCRLFYFDYYAATPTWREWYVFRTPQQANGTRAADCVVSPRNGNLYVGLYGQEWITEFTGATIERASWNRRHGLPDGTRLSPYSLAANENGLYVFCGPHPADGGSQGAALFMDDGQNFHPLYDATNRTVRGGGVGTDAIWVIVQDGTGGEARELANPDGLAVPPNVSGRTFDTAANVLVSPWLHMGLVNTNKRLLFFEIDCLKSDGTKGLNSGATVQVEYRGRGSASWTSAGTLTSAGVFPAVLAVAGGWSFKELQVRLTLTAGSSSAPALVRALKIGYRPRPKVRHTYQVRVDLRDEAPAFATADGLFAGYSASKLRTLLDEFADNDDAGQEDTLVGLAYGGEGNLLHPRRRSIPQCELTVLAQEDATGGDGLYLLAFSDVSAPTSG